MRLQGVLVVALCLLTPVLTGGCSGTPPTRSYVLNSGSFESIQGVDASGPLSVSVGPASVPGYLDRPQIVTRQSDNQLRIAQSDRWAESLQDGISRVVVENLSSLFADAKMSIYPWSASQSSDCRVVLNVRRLDGRLGGELLLKAHWQIDAKGSDRPAIRKNSTITVPVSGETYEDFAAAASEALVKLSRQIAADLKQFVKDSTL